MISVKSLSIKNKLISMILSVTLLSLVIGFSVNMYSTVKSLKEELVHNTEMSAKLVGETCVVPLTFENDARVTQILETFRTVPYIENGYVFNAQDTLIASFIRNDMPFVPTITNSGNFTKFEDGHLHVARPIVSNDIFLGTIYIRASTQLLDEEISNHLWTIVILVFALVLLSYFFALKFQAIISEPILKLAEATKTISADADYSLRVEKYGNDEIGILFDGFNEMMQQINLRRSERDSAEEMLRESEEKYRRLVEGAEDAIYLLQDEKFILFNPATARLLGYSEEELKADNFEPINLVAPESLEFMNSRNEARSKGKKIPQRFEFKLITKTGKILDIEAQTADILYKGKPAIQSVLRDMTEFNLTAKNKLDLEKRLAYSERMESLGVLAGGIAHDLNNILGPIVAYPDMIMAEIELNDIVKSDLLEIKSAAEKASDVIADLLTLARRGKYEMVPLKLNDVISSYVNSSVYKKFDSVYQYVDTKIELSDDIFNIMGSKSHLSKVVMNLVNNSFQSIRDEGTIGIRTYNESLSEKKLTFNEIPKGEYVVLEVEDDGNGIDKKQLGKIFDPFFTTKSQSREKGTGLGLSVVHGVVHDHKGFINVKSEEGIGTKISLYFPLTRNKNIGSMNNIDIDDYSGTEKILIVDDLVEQIDIAKRLLIPLGYKVVGVGNGHEAIDYLKNNSTDLVMLDMIMQDDFDGLDTYREIIKINPAQKVIIVSGYSASERVKEALKLGAGRYIKKPYTRETITEAVREELDRTL